jgi:hypothetical protein
MRWRNEESCGGSSKFLPSLCVALIGRKALKKTAKVKPETIHLQQASLYSLCPPGGPPLLSLLAFACPHNHFFIFF